KRSPLYPDAPPISETPGAESVSLMSWTGLAAPRGTPKALRERISADIARAIASPPVQARFRQVGYEVMDMGPDELAAFVERERKVWQRIIEAAQLRLD